MVPCSYTWSSPPRANPSGPRRLRRSIAHISNGRHASPDSSSEPERSKVPALTPATLLEQVGAERIDVLQIDTEGYDLEVLRLFDISRRRPSIVQFEHQHLNRRDRDAAAQLLVDAGYLVALIRYDTIAYLQP